MDTIIISLNINNLVDFDDEQKILNHFEKIEYINKVTVNVFDKNIIVSGNDITRESITELLREIGYEVA